MIISAAGESITLNEPELGNSVRRKDEILLHRMADNSITTYVRRKGSVKQFTFNLTRLDVIDLKAFVKTHRADVWTLTDDDDNVTTGILVENPLEFAMSTYDSCTITIEIDENYT